MYCSLSAFWKTILSFKKERVVLLEEAVCKSWCVLRNEAAILGAMLDLKFVLSFCDIFL